MMVIFYKVTTNTELVNTKPFIVPKANRDGFSQVCDHDIFINPSIHNVFLFKDISFNVVNDSLIMSSQPTAL